MTKRELINALDTLDVSDETPVVVLNSADHWMELDSDQISVSVGFYWPTGGGMPREGLVVNIR